MSMSSIEFNKIDSLDRDAVYESYKDALFPVIENTFGWNEAFQRERFQTSYQLNWFHWIELSEKRIGYICYWEKANEIHLSLLIINSDARSEGYGTLVMNRLHEIARAKRSKVTLSSFRNNTGAIKFYERLGYKVIGGDEHFVDMVLETP